MAGRVRIGTQGWNYPAWLGPFYPEGTRPADMLTVYAQAFETVEVDSTFYAIPPANSVLGWRRRTPDGFVFSLKMPREITHERHLRGVEEDTALFLERARLVGPKLGPILVQMGPEFSPYEMDALEGFLPLLPRDLRFAVEMRQARWARPEVLADLLPLLAEHGVALAVSDGRWMPREAVLELALRPTADFLYVRWMGPDRDLTDFSHVQVRREGEIADWCGVLRMLPERGIDLFAYVNNHFEGHSPSTAREVQRLLGVRPVEPSDLGEQISLF